MSGFPIILDVIAFRIQDINADRVAVQQDHIRLLLPNSQNG
jgi:hypothetical protein